MVPFGIDGELELVAGVQIQGDGIGIVPYLFQLVGVRNHFAPVGGHQQIPLAGANNGPAPGIFRVPGKSGKDLGIFCDGLREVEFHAHGGGSKPAKKGITVFFRRPGNCRTALRNLLRLQNGVTVHVLHSKSGRLLRAGTTRKQRDDQCGDQCQDDPF